MNDESIPPSLPPSFRRLLPGEEGKGKREEEEAEGEEGR